jgi:thioredoxin reductase
MSWLLLLGVTLALGLSFLAAAARRAEIARMETVVRARDKSVRSGAAKDRLLLPVIDLSRCLGCATCVSACPEDGVLELVHGQALVVRGARCQGIAACARECPVGAITVTLADLRARDDVPVVSESLEATGAPGLFLAGEVTAHALIKTALEHGKAVAGEVAERARKNRVRDADAYDLVIVGAGPAGLACALEAKLQGLSYVLLEQEEEIGGTVARYPRRKLVVTQPVDLPLVGRLKRTTYTKEELIDLWKSIAAEQELVLALGARMTALERDASGHFLVRTGAGDFAARHVCLALGRRGTPNKIGVPGEDLPKVAYSLLDAASYSGRRVLVVGGGDSAIETALALAEQPGNEVLISYRREAFVRLTTANEGRLARALEERRLKVLFQSNVRAIHPEEIELDYADEQGVIRRTRVPNDEVFVMAGGRTPFELLQQAGVSFDASKREPPKPVIEQGTGLLRALGTGFLVSLAALAWAVWHAEYYTLSPLQRPTHDDHRFLRPGDGAGLFLGVLASALIVANLAYLLRRSPRTPWFKLGSLQAWMTSHVATGVLALLCAALHAAMDPGNTAGGHAFWALAVLLVSGAVGRYFYSYVPREANGRELELAEVKGRLIQLAEEWDQGQRRFREHARDAVQRLADERRWQATFLGRVLAMLRGRSALKRLLADLAARGRAEGLARPQIEETLELARRAYAAATAAAHYEDLRAVANTWRYLHRWVAVLMVVLVAVHIVYALIYGERLGGGR